MVLNFDQLNTYVISTPKIQQNENHSKKYTLCWTMDLWNSKSSAEKFFSWRLVRIISGDGGDNYLITEEYREKNEDNSTSSNSRTISIVLK